MNQRHNRNPGHCGPSILVERKASRRTQCQEPDVELRVYWPLPKTRFRGKLTFFISNAYLIDWNQVYGILDRVLLKISSMDGRQLKIFFLHRRSICIRVPNMPRAVTVCPEAEKESFGVWTYTILRCTMAIQSSFPVRAVYTGRRRCRPSTRKAVSLSSLVAWPFWRHQKEICSHCCLSLDGYVVRKNTRPLVTSTWEPSTSIYPF